MTRRQQQLEQICQQAGIAILYVFGSRALETVDWLHENISKYTPSASDIDIGVLLPPHTPWSVVNTVALTQTLEGFLGVPRVDLVLLASADPFLAANIIRGERLYARSSHEADEYDLFVLRRAGDLIPLERERQDLIIRNWS